MSTISELLSEPEVRVPEQAPESTAVVELATASEVHLDHDEIAALAYGYWLERGCPNDSPPEERDADWFRAESELRSRIDAASKTPAQAESRETRRAFTAGA